MKICLQKSEILFEFIPDLISDDIEARSQVLDTLLDELNEQNNVLEDSESKLETLEVELVRTGC